MFRVIPSAAGAHEFCAENWTSILDISALPTDKGWSVLKKAIDELPFDFSKKVPDHLKVTPAFVIYKQSIGEIVKNALDAKCKKVYVSVDWQTESTIKVIIRDDGPGFKKRFLEGAYLSKHFKAIEERLDSVLLKKFLRRCEGELMKPENKAPLEEPLIRIDEEYNVEALMKKMLGYSYFRENLKKFLKDNNFEFTADKQIGPVSYDYVLNGDNQIVSEKRVLRESTQEVKRPSESTGGSGMGLAQAHRALQKNDGGLIEIQNPTSGGACVVLTSPVMVVQQDLEKTRSDQGYFSEVTFDDSFELKRPQGGSPVGTPRAFYAPNLVDDTSDVESSPRSLNRSSPGRP